MILFATPDFGTGAMIAVILLIVWAVVLALVAVGLVWGAWLLRRTRPGARKYGGLLILVSGAVPFFCCLAPPCAIRVTYGNYPIGSYPDGKIQEGMSAEEVKEILGTPHERGGEATGSIGPTGSLRSASVISRSSLALTAG
jgi:hypothetical protein